MLSFDTTLSAVALATLLGKAAALPHFGHTELSRRTYPSGSGKQATTITLAAPLGGQFYTVNVTIGGQPQVVLLDTGSSDLWIHSKNVTCIDVNTGNPSGKEACAFGPGGYDPATSSTYQPLPFENNFNATYAGGAAFGVGATDTLVIGDLLVPNVTFAIAEFAAFDGGAGYAIDGVMGLASPLLTMLFNGRDGSKNNASDESRHLYEPWFYQAVEEGLIEPYFSLALDRTPPESQKANSNTTFLGSFTIGGIPDISVKDKSIVIHNPNFTVPIQDTEVLVKYFSATNVTFSFPGSTSLGENATSPIALLDSGTTNIIAPSAVAKAFNGAIVPSPMSNETMGSYIVQCNASIPDFSVTIEGVEFPLQKEDLVFYNSVLPEGFCISSIAPPLKGQEGISILGNRFLVNVISTYNVKTDGIILSERQRS
ncbi:hypothetical protein I302_100887 [Kwoniella bestiolae CBS 10118]|uniref:Peptidase A1 domain-containing protein n=1 Tax=Kwoniella bestiolae CBS 10118 TaxID=1296100 RepID=A0A1B9G6B8_9TREE|nr:hypothetical protein I302_04261 [Kwoniella bestiolae CBS 10118]OCF26575.1 hypothetical protein I302_04261 [Kwoniella bestiolae CBS 10118]